MDHGGMDTGTTLDVKEERRIILRCQGGDMSEYGRIVRQYHHQVLGLARKYLQDCEEARDLTQDVFLQGMLKIRRFDPDRSFKTWISTIAVRRSIDCLRRRRLFLRYLEQEGGRELRERGHCCEEVDAPRRVAESDLFAPLLNRLTPRQRQVLLLYMDKGWTARKIAGHLNCTPSTVRGYLFSARRTLRRLLVAGDFPLSGSEMLFMGSGEYVRGLSA